MTAIDQYTKLLIALHIEMRAGRGEQEYANQLRDEMDPLWQLLTDIEREAAAELSETLYAAEADLERL